MHLSCRRLKGRLDAVAHPAVVGVNNERTDIQLVILAMGDRSHTPFESTPITRPRISFQRRTSRTTSLLRCNTNQGPSQTRNDLQNHTKGTNQPTSRGPARSVSLTKANEPVLSQTFSRFHATATHTHTHSHTNDTETCEKRTLAQLLSPWPSLSRGAAVLAAQNQIPHLHSPRLD